MANFICAAFILLLPVFSFVRTMPARAAEHSNLEIGISQYPASLHPMFGSMMAKDYVLGMAQRPVTAYDANWRPICLMCQELPTFENGLAKRIVLKDGKKGIAATYTIRKDITWGDGVPVTAKDIVFAWQVGKNPVSGVADGDFFSKDIASVTAVGEKTFVIDFAKRDCDFASIEDFYALPAHLDQKIFEKNPAAYRHRSLYSADPTNPGLYWGPYVIAHVQPGAGIVLRRNPYWQGRKPAFESVTVKTIENGAALAANLLSGDIDYIAGEMGLTLDQALALRHRLPAGYKTIFKPGLIYEHIDINLSSPILKDIRVRQALMYGMNRAAINASLFGGRQPVAVSFVNPLDAVYDANVQKYPYDPAKAKQLLDAAGWRTRPDGVRENKAGQKLSFTLATTAGNDERAVIEQAVQSDWQKIGVKAVIANQMPRVLFGQTLRKRTFTGGVMYAWISAPREIPKTTLYSAMIPSAKNSYSGQNYPGYNNKQADHIIDQLQIICAPRANQDLWNALQTLYVRDLPALPLYYSVNTFFIPPWLSGIVPTGDEDPTTLWIEDWRVAS